MILMSRCFTGSPFDSLGEHNRDQNLVGFRVKWKVSGGCLALKYLRSKIASNYSISNQKQYTYIQKQLYTSI